MTSPTTAEGAGGGALAGAGVGSIFGPIGALIGAALGGAVGGYGAYTKGQDIQSMNNYQARVAQINAGIAGEQAAAETAAGDLRQQQSGLRTADRMGLTRAGMAAGGLDLGGGSAKGVLSSEAEVGQFEQASIRNDAARRAYGARVAQFGDVAQSNMDIAAGRGARTAAAFDVGTSVLGAATSVSDKWTKFNETLNAPPLPYGDPSTA